MIKQLLLLLQLYYKYYKKENYCVVLSYEFFFYAFVLYL